jgi:hypothetical protein
MEAEERVERREGKKEKVLEVRLLFEPGRLSGECLADAYEHLVPVVRRALNGVDRKAHVVTRAAVRRAGGAGA